MYDARRNAEAGAELQRLDFQRMRLEEEMKSRTVEYNMFDLDPDIPIYRITPIEHLVRDVRDRTLTLTRINKTSWGDDRENPILGRTYSTESGEEVMLATTANIFGLCWSRRLLDRSDDWAEFGHGRFAVRIKTTPRKLLSGSIDASNRYYRLQHWIGTMAYKSQSEIDSFSADPDFTKHLDSTGARAMLSLLRLRSSLSSEEEVRLLFEHHPGSEWDRENVRVQEPRAAVRFDWVDVVRELSPEPGLSSSALAELRSLLRLR